MQKKICVTFLIIACLALTVPIYNGKSTVNPQTFKILQTFAAKPEVGITANLVPVGASFSIDPIVEDETVTVNAQIENQGLKQVRNVLVRFKIIDDSNEEVFVDDMQIVRVKALSSASVSTQWTPTMSGDYTITVVVDPNNAIAETDENDNALSETFTVIPSIPTEPVHDVAITDVSPSPTNVEIGETVLVTVVAENQGDFLESFVVTAYYDSVAIGTKTVNSLDTGDSITLDFSWDTTGIPADTYSVSASTSTIVGDIDPIDNSFTDGTVTVTAPGAFTHRIFVEIDYMVGHEPTPAVLTYITGYYAEKGISVIFDVDDEVPYDSRVSDRDFSKIETQYNDNDFGYYSEYKWVLFGTTVFRQSNVIGYTYVQIGGGDLLAGNYIFIADGAADSWSQANGLSPECAEAVVLMHEFGHSIGIAELDSNDYEVYCNELTCVMAMLNPANAGYIDNWYYCDDHWNTVNLSYYEIL